ncbi:cardiomyopathy-associated protein 5-like isoform X5 [Entelurus aequoreus]|uniref:cardiomyopathy-associated protein 5-like isoform X5 n=1 Tax=Entelurus aequoreus TaxID=161455 RepID=UPI002B1E781A|nr:cardiomyopathy-associated protein 5-like isoform X5 [Entelurus aequoreus]
MCERTIAEYEEELCPTKEEKERQHQVVLHTTDIHQLIGHQEECLSHLQGDSFTLEDPQPSHFKGDEEDPHMKEEEEGECPVGQEEDDVMTVVSVKTEEHEDKARESSQLHHSPNVQQPLHIKEEEEDPQPTHIKKEEDDPQPTHIKDEEEDPQPTHIKKEEDDPQPTHIKDEEDDPQPTHIKDEEDDPQPTHIKEEDEDTQPTHIKEEEEDPQPPHMKEEGECVVGQEEDDVMTVVSVKTEEHEDKAPESSQLHHSPNVQRVSAGSHEEEWHTSVGQKELQAPSHIKEEQLHDEDEAQSLQLHHSQSEENRGAELSSSIQSSAI